MKWLVPALLAVLLAACDTVEVTREIGYKGRARANPWLAAERFCQRYDREVRSLAEWEAPGPRDAVWFVPAMVLGNRSFVRQMATWVGEGGHLVVLLEHAGLASDWGREPPAPEFDGALEEWLEQAGISLQRADVEAETLSHRGKSFAVDAASHFGAATRREPPAGIASVRHGAGRLTVVTDGRLFRNRWIAEKEHAALLDALVRSAGRQGAIGFLRGSGLSLWDLLGRHLWPVLLALAVLIVFWLWKNLARFGPLEPESAGPPLRGYEHHLEALGDFQWRLDHCAALLAPLRETLVERAQRLSARAGLRDQDVFQFLADRSGLPRDRVHRALAESRPADPAVLTRTTADLQALLRATAGG